MPILFIRPHEATNGMRLTSFARMLFRRLYTLCLPLTTTVHSNVIHSFVGRKYVPREIIIAIRAINMFNRLPIVQIHSRDMQCGTHHIQGNWDENITSRLYGIRHLSKPLSRVNVYIQCGRKNGPRMKPSTYPNSAKAGHHGDVTFYEQKQFFQKTKIFPSSFSTSQFLIFTTETGWKLST